MRVSFVSDVHGNVEGLARVAQQSDQLVILGDLLDYVDYHEPGRGVLGSIFGAERVMPFRTLRSAGRFVELRDYNRSLWASLDDPVGTVTEYVANLYRQVLDAIGPSALLTLGNVDVSAVWDRVAGTSKPYLDGQVVTVAGKRFGFVGGGSTRPGFTLRPPDTVWQPFMRSAQDYASVVAALGPVDVLCSHLPPDIPLLRYDRLPGRMEMYGPGLLESIDLHAPELAVFGHVHQPQAQRTRRGRTECVNVGHFQRNPVAYEVELG